MTVTAVRSPEMVLDVQVIGFKIQGRCCIVCWHVSAKCQGQTVQGQITTAGDWT